MTVPTHDATPARLEFRALGELLAQETTQYEALLGLARDQHRLMRDQDVTKLAENTQLWHDQVAAAEAVRGERERCAADLLVRLVPGASPAPLSDWLPRCPERARSEVAGPLRRARIAASQLGRQVELNRRLAEFCLDLVEEEAAIFRHAVLADPAGRYAQDARKAQSGQPGVMIRQG